jgi:GMP synthase-like glutamine amidotransferase
MRAHNLLEFRISSSSPHFFVLSVIRSNKMVAEEAWMTMEIMSSESPPQDPTISQKIVGDPHSNDVRSLNFVMLGCEPKMPYGPIDHTAQLLADLLGMAAHRSKNDCYWMIRIKTYNAQEQEYPVEWDSYDGVLLPGSFASAYDTDPWIEKLKQVLQTEIAGKRRPTLGVCFGHQILAHSFPDGKAAATPTGPQAGRYAMETTESGAKMLNNKPTIDFYFTHGDMVEQLPCTALSLGGNEDVPILAAAYFSTLHEVAEWSCSSNAKSKPYAITFQAHPEYATSMDLGVFRTLHLCMDAMERRGGITKMHRMQAGQDSTDSFAQVQTDSIDTMVAAGRLLGWFP